MNAELSPILGESSNGLERVAQECVQCFCEICMPTISFLRLNRPTDVAPEADEADCVRDA